MTDEQQLIKFKSFVKKIERKYFTLLDAALREQIDTFISTQRLDSITSIGLYKVVTDLYIDAGVKWANYTRLRLNEVKRMPMGFSERIVELMQQYFGLDLLNMCENMTQTTRDEIALVLTQSAQEGFGFNEVINRLSEASITAIRARIIARTETVAAANLAGNIQANEYEFEVNKRWLSLRDARTRHSHVNVNGVEVGLNDYFSVNGSLMQHPGDKGGRDGQLAVPAKEVCNCRCTLAYVPKRDRNGKLIMK